MPICILCILLRVHLVGFTKIMFKDIACLQIAYCILICIDIIYVYDLFPMVPRIAQAEGKCEIEGESEIGGRGGVRWGWELG